MYISGTSFHKNTRVVKGEDGVEVMNMIELVLGKREMLQYVRNRMLHCVKLGWWVH